MNFKKVSTLFVTGAMVAAMSVCGFADDYAQGTAYLSVNGKDWVSIPSTTAEITADGQYTLSASVDEATDLEPFMAIQIAGGEELFADKYPFYITVDSIKLNGEDVALQGDSYTCSADGKGVDTRCNLYNEYNNPDHLNEFDADGFSDQRVATVSGKETACLLTDAVKTGFKSIEVTFTVSGLADEAQPDGDVAPIAYLAALVAVAGIAMVASKKRA
jgi:hypothetical protein